jgi:PAS domain-containing protein
LEIAKSNNSVEQSVIAEQSHFFQNVDLSTLLGNLPGIAYRCRNDQDWTMEFVSAGCLELTGYHSADLINNKHISYSALIEDEDRQRVWMVIQSALLHKQPFRLIYRINTAAGEQK